ncbi:MAG: hypothetical protein QOI78_457 [Actinomycetota bacterium]|nr:hypothetical protein [Actinomycetota bacterium]
MRTDAIRLPRRARRRTWVSIPSSAIAVRVPCPPTTSVVSIRPVTEAGRRAPVSAIPDELRTPRPVTVAGSIAYGGTAPWPFAISRGTARALPPAEVVSRLSFAGPGTPGP